MEKIKISYTKEDIGEIVSSSTKYFIKKYGSCRHLEFRILESGYTQIKFENGMFIKNNRILCLIGGKKIMHEIDEQLANFPESIDILVRYLHLNLRAIDEQECFNEDLYFLYKNRIPHELYREIIDEKMTKIKKKKNSNKNYKNRKKFKLLMVK